MWEYVKDEGQDLTGESEVYVAFGRRNEDCQCVRITFTVPQNASRECGFVYVRCSMDPNEVVTCSFEDLQKSIKHFCLLLPYQRKNRRFEHEYAVVFHDWDVIGGDGSKCLSSLCRDLFSNDVME